MWEYFAGAINAYLERNATEIALTVLSVVGSLFGWFAIWLKAKTKIDTQKVWSEMLKGAAATGAAAVVFDRTTPNDDDEAVNAVIRHITASIPEILQQMKANGGRTTVAENPAIVNIAKSALQNEIAKTGAAISATIESK